MLNPNLVQIQTQDGLTLPGLLYKSRKSKKAAIFLHGNGSSSVFYSDDTRHEYAEEFARKDISFLALNNRGAHYIKKLSYAEEHKEPERFGMAYEIIKESIYDVNACTNFLKNQGIDEFYLIGESTGANKICVYDNYEKDNTVAKYILLGGGDDVGIYYDELGDATFWRLLEESKKKIAGGKGDELIIELLPSEIFSYKGFYDMANPDGDYNVFPFYEEINNKKLSKEQQLFEMYKSLRKPTLSVYGEKDEYAWGDIERVVGILKKYNPAVSHEVIKGADHSFTGKREKLAKVMTKWITSDN